MCSERSAEDDRNLGHWWNETAGYVCQVGWSGVTIIIKPTQFLQGQVQLNGRSCDKWDRGFGQFVSHFF